MSKVIAILVLIALAAIPAAADIFQVEISGEVDSNFVHFGQFANVTSGDAVLVQFQVDSEDYLDSPDLLTRGYPISNYSIMVGTVTVGLCDPYPVDLVPYYVLSDNDSDVDLFRLLTGTEYPPGVYLDAPGNIDPFLRNAFTVCYDGDTLGSLDIAGAVGTYGQDGLGGSFFNLLDGPYYAITFLFTRMTISIVSVATQARTLTEVKNLFR